MAVELEHAASFGKTFGQLGQADMIGQVGDTGFDGHFFRIGVEIGFGPGAAIASYEYGSSPGIFEDLNDPGSYSRIDMAYEFPVAERAIISVGAAFSEFRANSEDVGTETNFRVGLRIPLGRETARNNLQTTYMPALAAAWAETLD